MANQVRIKLVKSPIGSKQNQKDTLKALGLTKMNSEVVKYNTVSIQGMIKKIEHLVEIEEI